MGITTSKPDSELSAIVSPTSIMVTVDAGTSMYSERSEGVVGIYMARLEESMHISDVAQKYQAFMAQYPEIHALSKQTLFQRKKTFYEETRKELEKGDCGQVVLFGDGINPMVVALAEEFPQVDFLCTDIDMKIQETRKTIFEELGLNNIYIAELDVEESKFFEGHLEASCFDPKRKIIGHMEGLITWVDQKAVIQRFMSMNPKNVLFADYGSDLSVSHPYEHQLKIKGEELLREELQDDPPSYMVDKEKIARELAINWEVIPQEKVSFKEIARITNYQLLG